MAKISPVSIKYMVYAVFEAEAAVEKPDVIGAIFGQTEGLLGTDLEMRELQKEGKIGRIEVELKSQNGKTTGKIDIPSALDKTETTLIAAAIETIERIGPSNAEVKVEKIEDVRENKREYILERAKKLLEGMEQKMPKTKEIAESLKNDSRTDKIKEYGEEKLPVGDIDDEKEILVVEGRADVINLLRNGIKNVIGMNGTNLPETIKKLSKDKEITLFLDGDRGGLLIARNVIDNASIEFVCFAPDGKEVEELSGKEILVALRKKIPIQEFLNSFKRKRGNYKNSPFSENAEKKKSEDVENLDKEIKGVNLEDYKDKLEELLNTIKKTRAALVLDKKLDVIEKVSIRGIFSNLERIKNNAYAIIVDTATQNVVNAVEKNNIKNIVANNFSFSGDTKVNLVSL
ncbi:MAG: DNA primase [Nanoarchaeota archaeon]|nr:DNA primase [Nanoarchaeota archaeon]